MKIEEVFKIDSPREMIEELKKGRSVEAPDVEQAEKALDPKKHDVYDYAIRPDEKVIVDDTPVESEDYLDDEGIKKSKERMEPVARIGLALQKLIIARASAFVFGNPVKYNAEEVAENQKLIKAAFDKILHDAKSASLDRKIAKTIFGYRECAELWYATPVTRTKTGSKLANKVKDAINNFVGNYYHNNYGFKSGFKLKCALFSPKDGDTLYPYFEDGDMIAFSREFLRKDETGKEIRYFETWTDTQHWLFTEDSAEWTVVEGYPKPVTIGKIPIVYGYQEEFETRDVDDLIARLEKLLSNFADTNDYHGSPTIVVKGRVRGFAKKGKAGKVLELMKGDNRDDVDPNAEYLAWQHAPESIKLEIETLLRMIYTLTQTPDISFDSVKGIGAISGIALKLLFMDAHLKAMEKQEIFDPYLTRRANIVKAFIGKFNVSLERECEEMSIDPEITPFVITSEIDDANFWIAANGGKPIISQKESAEKAGLSSNSEADYKQMQEEASHSSYIDTFEPTV